MAFDRRFNRTGFMTFNRAGLIMSSMKKTLRLRIVLTNARKAFLQKNDGPLQRFSTTALDNDELPKESRFQATKQAPGFRSKMQNLKNSVFRDLRLLKMIIQVRLPMIGHEVRKDDVVSVFQRTATKFGEKPALIGKYSKWSFTKLDNFSNQIANYALKHGVRKNDVVAVFGTSSPDYVGIWLGLAKVRAVSALINSNLRMDPLINSIAATNAKVIFVELELKPAFEEIQAKFPQLRPLYYFPDGAPDQKTKAYPSLNLDLNAEKADFEKLLTKDTMSEKLFYVYTSGRTGNPKACIISHRRFIGFTNLIYRATAMTPDEIIYCPLPLYHTAGGIATMGQALVMGCTLVIPKKFSASRFWKDIVENNCTAFQYIGEICRFLLAQPKSEFELKHKLRIAYGQGLRQKIWTEFVDRFKIPRLMECYGATEANVGMANTENKPGALGHLSPALHGVHPIVLARVDRETGDLIRGEDGFFQYSKPGEDGELLGKIIDWDPMRKFDGYTDKQATSSRVIHNVFQLGDKFFRSGDLMMSDMEGFIYFGDRLGDSYRWKGENISSSEVEAVVSKICCHADAVAFGVTVPGTEGKAGMVCIVPNQEPFNMKNFYEDMKSNLPSYAIPVFVKLTSSLDMTGTFKIQKAELKKKGFKLGQSNDERIFYLDQENKEYKPLDQNAYDMIRDERIRF